jgi:GMP synthase (glutamine-hydrolysing)
MKKVLAFRHVPFEGIGRIGAALAERGIACDYADLYSPGSATPDIAAYDGLIFLGGPMSANDPLPFLAREVQLISSALERHQPLLGICLGSQLIARALGADVCRNPVKEIGWFPVRFLPDAAEDRLFTGLFEPETIFHWHSDTWALPPHAVRLASSDLCANQAFRSGDNVYGLQFHLEVTPEMIADWMAQEANCGDVCGITECIDPYQNAIRMTDLSSIVYGRWLEVL